MKLQLLLYITFVYIVKNLCDARRIVDIKVVYIKGDIIVHDTGQLIKNKALRDG